MKTQSRTAVCSLALLLIAIALFAPQSALAVDADFARRWVLGDYNPWVETDVFTEVPVEYTIPAPGKEYTFNRDALSAFIAMRAAAAHDGIRLQMLSTLRNFTYQKRIWDRKYADLTKKYGNDSASIVREIITYSAMPTTSRHHWGTDADINSVEPAYFDVEPGRSEYAWLRANAHKFGFCQPYDSKDIRARGYNEEKWHWSYMPVSKRLYEFYRDNITYDDIKGFSGAQAAREVNMIDDYVLSINRECIDFDISVY